MNKRGSAKNVNAGNTEIEENFAAFDQSANEWKLYSINDDIQRNYMRTHNMNQPEEILHCNDKRKRYA